MQVTLGSLTHKYSYLICLSLSLLISCTNKEAVQSRRYLISNAEKLGIVNANYSTSEPEEKTIYHKIFKNFQGTSDYRVKKTPKNNPYHYKLKVSQKAISGETTNTKTPVLNPKVMVTKTATEEETIVNHTPSDKGVKAPISPAISNEVPVTTKPQVPQTSDTAVSPKAPVASPETPVTPQPQMPQANDQSAIPTSPLDATPITPATPMSLPEIKPAAYVESTNDGSTVTILPPLSSLFENEEASANKDAYADKPLEDVIAQAIQENKVIDNEITDNYISDTPEQDSLDNFKSNDEVLPNKQVDDFNQDEQIAKNIPSPGNKKETLIAPVVSFDKEANSSNENQLFKRKSLIEQESTPFIKKYFAADGTLLMNNFAQINVYSNLY